MSPKLTLVSIVLLTLTTYCSYIGDDDIVYKFADRKPTPREAIIRLRWVMLKAVTSIYVGCAATYSLKAFLAHQYSLVFSHDSSVLTGFCLMALASLLIGALQNIVRRLTARPTRPIIDLGIFRRNLGITDG
jgi:hypothetical protein